MNTNKTILPIGIVVAFGLLGLTNAALSNTPTSQQISLSSINLWNRSELYFGSGKPDGSSVTEKQFRQFVDSEVTPRFPDGLTLLTGYGQYKNSSGKIVKEQSFVLVILYQSKDANQKLESIRTAYKKAFAQESVLRVDDTTRVWF